MIDPKVKKRFFAEYLDYTENVLRPNEIELKKLFKEWREGQRWGPPVKSRQRSSPSPVQRGRTRIKRPESVADKLIRKAPDYPAGFSMPSVTQMFDTLGGRVMVYFLSSLPLVDAEIRQSDVLEISPDHKPIAYLNPEVYTRLNLTDFDQRKKESGYLSLHYIVRFREPILSGVARPWFELQVRTLVEDAWGEIEHVLGYKARKQTSLSVRSQFRIIASQLAAIDDHFDLIYELQTKSQDRAKTKSTALLNAENLPRVLGEWSIGVAQNEIDGLLKLLASRGFTTIDDFRRNAGDRRVDEVRRVYVDYASREPRDFETVAGLAAINKLPFESISDTIKSDIDVLDAWHELDPDKKK